MVKKVKTKSHGTEYYLCLRGKHLCGHPIFMSGKVGREAFVVTESPSAYKRGHIEVLKKLGVPQTKLDKILKGIDYY